MDNDGTNGRQPLAVPTRPPAGKQDREQASAAWPLLGAVASLADRQAGQRERAAARAEVEADHKRLGTKDR